MKTCSIINLTKKAINEVDGGINSNEQNNPKIGVDLGTTEDFLGGLKKDKIEKIDTDKKIRFKPMPINSTETENS